MKRVINYMISHEYQNKRIWDFLIDHGYSKHIRTYLKQHPKTVLKNNEPALFYFPLETGDRLTITLEDEEASEKIPPVALPLDIIYEDEDLMVINKQADTPIHPSQGNYENTLANGVAHYFASRQIPFVFRCINRLDRNTTGLLILAKNMLSGAILSDQMKRREIHRTYLSIVEGCVLEHGTIDAPIGRKDASVIERHIDWEAGERAVTHYERLKYNPCNHYPATAFVPSQGISLVKLKLETGRTHQIRVHMTSIGHPLCGDTLYNPGTQMMQRQALHSYSLEFQHPITKQTLRFTAPLPEDMFIFFNE